MASSDIKRGENATMPTEPSSPTSAGSHAHHPSPTNGSGARGILKSPKSRADEAVNKQYSERRVSFVDSPQYPSSLSLSPSSSSTSSSSLSSASYNSEASFYTSSLPQLRTASLPSLQDALEACKQGYGDNHQLTGVAYNDLGNWFFRHSDYSRAALAYKFSAYKCAFGSHTPNALANLGVVYWTVGELSQAQAELLMALESFALVNDQSRNAHLFVASVHHQLGLVYALQGHGKKATIALHNALWLREQYGSSRSVAKTMDAIGQVCCLAGDHCAAVLWYTHSLSHCRRLVTMENMAWAYYQVGDFESSLNVYKDMLDEQRQEYRVAVVADRCKISVKVVQTLKNIMVLLEKLKLTEDAEECRRELLTFSEQEGIHLSAFGL